MGDDQGGLLYLLNHIGHGKGLSRTGHTQKDLMRDSLENSLCQFFNGLRLVTFWLKLRNEFEWAHAIILQQKCIEVKGGTYIAGKLFDESF
jgi:hypothetical protein